MQNKSNDTNNSKKEDGKFPKKNIKHNPQAESTRVVYNRPSEDELDEFTD